MSESVARGGETLPSAVLGRLGAALAAESGRWALWIPVALGLGIAAYFALPVEPPAWTGLAGLALTGLAALAARRHPPLLAATLAAMAVCLGLAAAQARTAAVDAPVLSREIRWAAVIGRVAEVERLAAGRRLVLDRVRIEELEPRRTPERIRVRIATDEPPLWPGQWVRLQATLGPPSAPAAPGAFDFQRHAFFQGIGAIGFAFGAAEPIEPPGDAAGAEPAAWRIWLAGLRQDLTDRIQAALPGATGAIAAALTTGSRDAIPEPVLEAMRDSGLAHLLSISGLHFGLVAGILFVGTRALLALVPALALAYPIKKWAALAALLGSTAYLLISGGTVPTQRSFVMAGLVLLAVMVDRSAISMRLVAWAAAVILLLSPETLTGPSFQMSFAAVVCLIAAFEATRGYRARRRADAGWLRRLGHYAAALAATSLIATLATAPYAVYHFNRVADYGLVANMIAVPMTGFWVMPWAVIAFLLMPFGLERFGLVPMGWGIDGIVTVAETVAAWPGAVMLIPAIPTVALGLITLGGLWLCLWQRPWRLYGLAGVAAGVIAAALLTRPPDLLVSGDGRLIAVSDAGGRLLLSSRRAARFEGEIWLRRAGQVDPLSWPRDGYGADGRLACDSLGCLYRTAGRTVALVQEPAALAEDCPIADLVISTEPVHRRLCPTPQRIIDRFDLWRDGAHAVWIGADGDLTVRSVRDLRGTRPWVLDPQGKQ
jgi:competence protein ComEC